MCGIWLFLNGFGGKLGFTSCRGFCSYILLKKCILLVSFNYCSSSKKNNDDTNGEKHNDDDNNNDNDNDNDASDEDNEEAGI